MIDMDKERERKRKRERERIREQTREKKKCDITDLFLTSLTFFLKCYSYVHAVTIKFFSDDCPKEAFCK